MPDFAELVIRSLPTVTGNGLFPVNIVVPNEDSSFNTPSGTTQSDSYSYPLMNPAKLIGDDSQPYIPVALPAYISTLYKNVYHINTNLRNDISTAARDDRVYPTSYAVQQYVQSQIAGSQIIDGTGPAYPTGKNNTYIVTTTVNNTLIQNTNPAAGYLYPGGKIALFWMETFENSPRIGATKSVMFVDKGYLTDDSGVPTGSLAFIYAGENSFFINMGRKYRYYQFVYTGDFIQFIQSYDSINDSWDWLITNSMGVFSNTVEVTGNMSTENSSLNLPLPTGNTFGNL